MSAYRTHLTADYVQAMLDYDPVAGTFHWRHRHDRSARWNSRYAGTLAGTIGNGYRMIQLEEKGIGGYYAARIATLLMTGAWPQDQVDHINGKRADDRWENLRPANNSQNNQNRGPQGNNKTGLRGVSRWGSRWQARIQVNGEQRRIGAYATIEEAAAAYQATSMVLHGDFAAPEKGNTAFPRSKTTKS